MGRNDPGVPTERAMTPVDLDFGIGDRIARAADKARRVLAEIVDELGYDVATGACDCSRSNLIDALRGRDGRYVRLEWIIALHAVASPSQRDRIEAAVFPRSKPITTEERLSRLELR